MLPKVTTAYYDMMYIIIALQMEEVRKQLAACLADQPGLLGLVLSDKVETDNVDSQKMEGSGTLIN